ncbi:MAG TPA: c-type cytochrome [Cellvibrio sp.]
MMKYTSAALLALVFASSTSFADDAAINAKYEKSCKLCHDGGLMGAPKTGDVAAWAPRLEKGNDVLMKHIKEGFNAMPPKGTCMDCTDEEFQKLLEKMSK